MPGAEKIRLSRDGNGDVREEVVTVYQDGNLEKTLSRVSVTDIQWGSGGATVSLSMDVICGDETRYYCGVDGVETITFINVFRKYAAINKILDTLHGRIQRWGTQALNSPFENHMWL